MRDKKFTALTLLLTLFATCFFSAPVLADHPWDIDTGGDTKGTNDVGDRNSDKGMIEVPSTTTSSMPSEVAVIAPWTGTVWLVYNHFFSTDRTNRVEMQRPNVAKRCKLK